MELKPCPFCGGEAKRLDHLGVIRCGTCKSESNSCNIWNGRPVEDRLKAENERLREFVKNITDINGKYSDLNGHYIVADAYKALQEEGGE